MAEKLNHKFPYLGSHTYRQRGDPHNYTTPSWIHHLSRGGLCEPSEFLINIGQIMENLFNQKKYFMFKEQSNRLFLEYFKQNEALSNINEEILKLFIRQRIFIRIKFLNLEI